MTKTMRRACIHLFWLTCISWYLTLFSITAITVTTNFNSTCKVMCICYTPPARWNQFPCCTESFLHRTVRNSRDGRGPVESRNSIGKSTVHAKERKRSVERTSENSSCVYPFVYSEPLHREFQEIAEDTPFRTVHACRREHIGSELHSKCLDFSNVSSLERVIPVVGTHTKVIYANRFCAECSGIYHFEPFIHQLVCTNELLGHWELLTLERTRESEPALIRSGLCAYYLEPSKQKILKNFGNRCVSARYADCSHSGQAVLKWHNTFHDNEYWSMTSQDGTYCSFCDMSSHSAMVQSGKSVLTSCIDKCDKYPTPLYVLTLSFFSLMSVDKIMVTNYDDPGSESRDMKCGNQSRAVYDKLMGLCRRVFCPLFHVRKGQTCYPAYTNLGMIPKLTFIRFHELNKTSIVKDPYMNFQKVIKHIVERHILRRLLKVYPLLHTPSSPLYMNFYQRQGPNESDFVLEYAWLAHDLELVPEAFKLLFNTTNVIIPIPHTSTLFEAKAVTNFVKNDGRNVTISDDNLTISKVKYNRIFHWDYGGNEFHKDPFHWDYAEDKFNRGANTRFLLMSPLILCNRVSLSLSEWTLSDDSFVYNQHSSKFMFPLPEHYIITEDFIEMCADEYFHLTNQTFISQVGTVGDSQNTVDKIAIILSFVCSCISIVSLLITIATYLLFDSLRTLPGKINLCLCISLLVAQILQQFTIDLIELKKTCIVFGILIHFSWSATLCWMSVSSFNLFRCFSPSNINRHDSPKSLAVYAAFVVIVSTFLVMANLTHSLLGEGDFGYGQGICYISSRLGLLSTFVAPVGVMVISNICFLSVTIWRISHAPSVKGKASVERNNAVIYMKMSTLTGACWIFGFLGILTEVDVFEILFILANASHGLFLMISFVCNQRVIELFKELKSRKKQNIGDLK